MAPAAVYGYVSLKIIRTNRLAMWIFLVLKCHVSGDKTKLRVISMIKEKTQWLKMNIILFPTRLVEDGM